MTLLTTTSHSVARTYKKAIAQLKQATDFCSRAISNLVDFLAKIITSTAKTISNIPKIFGIATPNQTHNDTIKTLEHESDSKHEASTTKSEDFSLWNMPKTIASLNWSTLGIAAVYIATRHLVFGTVKGSTSNTDLAVNKMLPSPESVHLLQLPAPENNQTAQGFLAALSNGAKAVLQNGKELYRQAQSADLLNEMATWL